jgi:hypothetical protein
MDRLKRKLRRNEKYKAGFFMLGVRVVQPGESAK